MFQLPPQPSARTTTNEALRTYAATEFGRANALAYLLAAARAERKARTRARRWRRPRRAASRHPACAVSARRMPAVEGA